jgi:hypothetical protein
VVAPLKMKVSLTQKLSHHSICMNEARYSTNKNGWNEITAVILFNLTA